MQIQNIKVRWEQDENPDLSWLGEYSSSPGPGCIDRFENGDQQNGQHRYWIPGSSHYPHNPASWSHVRGESLRKVIDQYGGIAEADAAYLLQDYARMEAYQNNEWCMMGVWAIAEVTAGEGGGVVQSIRSGGLWGIESDSDDDHREGLAADELTALRNELEDFGAMLEAIDAAMINVNLLA